MADEEILENALRDLDARVQEELPELAELADRMASGDLDMQEAMVEVMRIAKETNNAEMLEGLFNTTLAPLREGGVLTTDDIVTKPSGGQMINPLVQAALIERIQFDSDIPEMRTGPLPEGVAPAVPVSTNARDPLVIGAMLEEASEEIARRHEDRIEDLRAEGREPGKEMATVDDDLSEYRRGEVPAPLSVPEPSPGTLATLPLGSQQKYARAVVATTQGRRSAGAVIAREVCKKINVNLGGEVDRVSLVLEPCDDEYLVASESWVIGLPGEEEVQPRFSPIDLAIGSLSVKLTKQLEGEEGVFLLFVDQTVDLAYTRSAGWAAKMWREPTC
jgi:hypothetical protein